MKSYQVVDFGKPLELREYENPKPKGKEILIKISACGVCHSDLHLTDGYFDLGDGDDRAEYWLFMSSPLSPLLGLG